MKRYVVGYLNCFDNDLILEVVEADSPAAAFWSHSKLQGDDWGPNQEITKGMSPEELQDWAFDFDMSVAVLEIP
jgi:hypothetical protein